MGVGARCARLVEYDTVEDLRQLVGEGVTAGAFHLGGGSNVLFVSGQQHTVLRSRIRGIEVTPMADGDRVEVKAGSGVTLDDLVALSCRWGLWGLENLSLIPGQVGGAAVQNVGAYGSELADSVVSVDAIDTTDGSLRCFAPSELAYGYRTSVFKTPGTAGRYIITAVSFMLHRKGRPNLRYRALEASASGAEAPADMRRAVIAMRRAKLPDPGETGSVGSYFVNPVVDAETGARFMAAHPEAPAFPLPGGEVKLSAAWLIDHAGCKEMCSGGASLWPQQPLVLVNTRGTATAADVERLEEAVRLRVLERYGIRLNCEVVKV